MEGKRSWGKMCSFFAFDDGTVSFLELRTGLCGPGTAGRECPEELDTAADPPASWMDEQGTEYRLKDWNVTEIPGKRVSRHVTRRMRYDGVEGAERIPESITVREEET